MSKRVKVGSSSTAIAYLRASTGRQKLSPEAQRASIEVWAALEGVTVAAWHTEHVCSVDAIASRVALPAALADIAAHGAGVLVVAKRDRLAREPRIMLEVEDVAKRLGARVVSAAGEGSGTSDDDEFIRGIHDLVNQKERRVIAARTRAALQVKAARGEKTGGTMPYGWTVADDGKTLIEVEAEQAVIARARAHRDGGLSFGKVAVALAAEGLVSRAGKPLVAMQVARMLAA